MLGRPESSASLGTIPCAISWLFRGISEQRHKCGTRFSVRVSAVELCTNTNQIRDLLAPYQNGKSIITHKFGFCLQSEKWILTDFNRTYVLFGHYTILHLKYKHQ